MKRFVMVTKVYGATYMVKVEAESFGQAERDILVMASGEARGYEVKVTAGFDSDDVHGFNAEVLKLMNATYNTIPFEDLYYVFKARNELYIQENLAKIEALNEQLERLKIETFNAMRANY